MTQALGQTTQTCMKSAFSLGVVLHRHHPGCEKRAPTHTSPTWKKSACRVGVIYRHHRRRGITSAPTWNSLDQTPAHRHPFSHPQTAETARDDGDQGAPLR